MDKNKVSIQPWFYKDATEIAFMCVLSLELHKCQGTLGISEAEVLSLRGD